ncbi:C39 family peptidase [Paenibacillus profundus]|uniref:C39 family peptidase n=1 Tax=Paenibacillus profundus TaxID=1173085 RepID=A0ABS8YER6_9BACL|nr:C39 family peptidase [Paenibacillus profundus]MCE5170057.1 C39 family peptidase [Paenibacillus profundus]
MEFHNFFISQNDQNYYPEATCGVASLSMLLKFNRIMDNITFNELAEELKLTVPPKKKGYDEDDQAIGTYPEDLVRFFVLNNIAFRMSFYDDEWKDSLKRAPIMVLMTGNEEEFGLRNSHWVVLVQRDKDFFTYLDPWHKKETNNYIKHMSSVDFHRYYTGIACQILT